MSALDEAMTRKNRIRRNGADRVMGVPTLHGWFVVVVAAAYGGLAVHERLPGDIRRAGAVWRVSHVMSGLCLAGFVSKADAMKAMRRIAKVTDWKRIARKVATPSIAKKVTAAVEGSR